MIKKFCSYTFLRNFRPSDAFVILFFLQAATFSFYSVGLLLAYERLLTGLLEIPLAVVTDRFGRRKALILSFAITTLSFAAFAAATATEHVLVSLYIGQTLFAIGDALRTGTHKAIILEWLDQSGRTAEKTRIMSVTRFYSKASAGASALLGGVMVLAWGRYEPLFMVSGLASLFGVGLILTYPRSLDGTASIATTPADTPAVPKPISRWRLGSLTVWTLIAASALFESNVKLAGSFLQPYLEQLLGRYDIATLGAAGALAIGIYQFVQGLLAGSASLGGSWLERRFGTDSAQNWLIVLSALILAVTTVSFLTPIPVVGASILILLAAAQNARRPLFITALDRHMKREWRTTVLSVENQARTIVTAGIVVAAGWLSDKAGIIAAFWIATLGLILSYILARIASRRLPGHAETGEITSSA